MARGVALLAEGVDRNRLWLSLWVPVSAVTLLAEGVDRNISPFTAVLTAVCRPPRGGRG